MHTEKKKIKEIGKQSSIMPPNNNNNLKII